MEFPELYGNKVIIAIKGLPCTGKSEVAELLGKWARCPVFYIDDFLGTLSLDQEPDYYYNNRGEAKRLHRLAFDGMCKSASERLKFSDCVVIKSRLSHRFELHRLAQLLLTSWRLLIIVECRMKNKVRWRDRLGSKLLIHGDEAPQWYKPRSWEDIEKARDEEEDDQGSWDDPKPYRRDKTKVVRMILDPYDDLNTRVQFHHLPSFEWLDPDFIGAMRYLVLTRCQNYPLNEPIGVHLVPKLSWVVQYAELRLYLAEQKLMYATLGAERSKYLCATNDDHRNCVFRSTTNGSSTVVTCGACQSPITPGEDIYACYFCILTLHKPCAEKKKSPPADFDRRQLLKRKCKSCIDNRTRDGNCYACKFQRCLLDPDIPIILNHGCHVEHHLSLQLHHESLLRICRGCGHDIFMCGYGCLIRLKSSRLSK